MKSFGQQWLVDWEREQDRDCSRDVILKQLVFNECTRYIPEHAIELTDRIVGRILQIFPFLT